MYLRKRLEAKIADQQKKISEFERQLSEAKAYLAGMQDSLKLLPSDGTAPTAPDIRPNSELAKAREVLRKEGKPLHIDELIKRLGKEPSRNTRGAMAGSIGSYVRKGTIFTRTGPNTFGLVEFEQVSLFQTEPPEEFGAE